MSTMHSIELERAAGKVQTMLCKAQHELIQLREAQLAELDRECNMHREGERIIEEQHESLTTRIEEICTHNALGEHGTALEQLERLAQALDMLDQMVSDQAARLSAIAKDEVPL